MKGIGLFISLTLTFYLLTEMVEVNMKGSVLDKKCIKKNRAKEKEKGLQIREQNFKQYCPIERGKGGSEELEKWHLKNRASYTLTVTPKTSNNVAGAS